MAHGIRILECSRTPQSKVRARSYEDLSGVLPRDSAQHWEVKDTTVQGVMPKSPESLEGHNSINTCPNGASEEFIGIYAKSRCLWTSCLIKAELELGRYGRLNPQRP